MATYHDLRVYNQAYELALKIHTLSLQLPSYLQFDLANQVRRASRSIPANIAEGYGRTSTQKEICHFLRISLGSCDEVLFNLRFIVDSKILSSDETEPLIAAYESLGKQIKQLTRSLTS